jgi:hypothetical protein
VDYSPILDVKAIRPESSPVCLLSEILKYQCKESDLVADPDWFCTYVKQVHGTRAVAVGGVLREYFQELEREPEDLIGTDNEDELDEGHLIFTWNRSLKRYCLFVEKPRITMVKINDHDSPNTG